MHHRRCLSRRDQGGRPLLWKTRDTTTPDNEVYYNTSYPNRFIAVVNANGGATSAAWMGVNEHGFALLNANSKDLDVEDKSDNGVFMRDALGHCRSVSMFRAMLDSTNTQRDVHASFGAIDSTGAAFIFEASRDTYWVYDAREAPDGYVIRTNFACNDTAGNGIEDCTGVERFLRSSTLVALMSDADGLSCESLLATQMRDFSEQDGTPLPVPCFDCGAPDSLYGVIDAEWSICRYNSVSAAIIHGVTPDAAPTEPAYLTTMWVMLGSPSATIAAPYWPVGPAPAAADGAATAPLCDQARIIRGEIFRHPNAKHQVDTFRLLDGNGGGLWAGQLPAEIEILATTGARLGQWRAAPPVWDDMLVFEDSLSCVVLDLLSNPTGVADGDELAGRLTPVLWPNRPNPFNPRTTIVFTLPATAAVDLRVFDLAGRVVRTIAAGDVYGPGRHELVWDGTDAAGRDAASGVYLCRLVTDGKTRIRRMALVR